MKSILRVYLAGGMHSNWREIVKEAVPQAIYYDPSITGLELPAAYTAWDLKAIEDCDVVFAYMAKDNPSGYGLSLEMGFALGLGSKKIIFVDELQNFVKDQDPRSRYFEMHRRIRLHFYTNYLTNGIDALGKLVEEARIFQWKPN